jgi:hypothetical protein
VVASLGEEGVTEPQEHGRFGILGWFWVDCIFMKLSVVTFRDGRAQEPSSAVKGKNSLTQDSAELCVPLIFQE